jgi:hypothetical protein
MSELRLSFPASAIAAKGRLTANDIELLKAETFPTGVRDNDGATLLMALNNSCREFCPEWADFFVGSLAEFIVRHSTPHGSLDDANALWIERMLAADGIVATELELKLLMHVMEISSFVPDSLKVFALSQLRHAIHGGSGALAGRRRGPQRGLTGGDIEFVRTVLAIPAAARQVRVSPAVYRVLLSIDAVSNPALNERAWVLFLYSVRADSPPQRQAAATLGRKAHHRRAAGIAA